MAENNEIILDIKINTDEVAQKLATATKQVDLLKQEQQNLTKAFKEGRIADVAYAKAMAESKAELEKANREVKASTALLQAETMARVDDTMSLDEQRQALNAAQKAYALLSGEAKEAADAEGGLRDQIDALNESVKNQEAAIGDHRRNVGNYTESINQAFGGIGEAMEKAGDSANSLAPAINALKGMGGNAQKAGDALDMIVKVMQLVGNAGKAMTAATKAQTVATEGQTVAQSGLNAVMAANPIGLVITGISTLLPLIQSFISSSKDAEAAQKAFNTAQEEYNKLVALRTREEEFDIEMMKIEGASEVELAEKRKENRWKDWQDAKDKRLKIEGELKKATEAGKKKLAEEYETQVAELTKIEEQAEVAYYKAVDKLALEQTKQTNEAVAASEKRQEEAVQNAVDIEMRKAAVAYENEQKLQAGLANIRAMANDMLKKNVEQTTKDVAKIVEDQSKVATPDIPLLARMWGLDDEGIEYLRTAIEAGKEPIEAAQEWFQQQLGNDLTAATEAIDEWTGYAAQAFESLNGLFDTLSDNELNRYKNENDQKQKMLDARLSKGLISEKEYNRQKEALDAQLQQKQNEAELKKAKRDKALAIMQAVIDTAVGIMKAVSENPMGGGLPGSAIAAAMGAIQIGTIAAQPLPQFATGGVVSGTSYTGDNVLARVNSGEMILNKQQQARLFDAISGGNGQTLGVDYEALALAVSNTPAPVVVYSELQEFGQKTTQYNEIASI